MEAGRPLISVLMISYNDEPYIREAISSVLAQSLTDFELVILDDGSTDGTERAVNEFSDPRIRYVRQENQGPSHATNAAINQARGEFIALTNGDGVSYPERLARQLHEHRRSGAGVIFVNADFIDEQSMPTTQAYWPRDLFLLPPMTRGQIVERFIFEGNFLPTFTTFAPRKLFIEAGPHDPLLLQLADLDHLCRLIVLTDFVVVPDCLVGWRLRSSGENLSKPALRNSIRALIESYLIVQRFLEAIPDELFVEAFASRFRNSKSRTRDELLCERAFLQMMNPLGYSRLIGAERLRALFGEPSTAALLEGMFHFTWREFSELLTSIDLMNLTGANEVRELKVADEQHRRNIEEALRDARESNSLLEQRCRNLEGDLEAARSRPGVLRRTYRSIANVFSKGRGS